MKVGDKVCYKEKPYSLKFTVTTIVIETKTRWITENGRRWNKEFLYEAKKARKI